MNMIAGKVVSIAMGTYHHVGILTEKNTVIHCSKSRSEVVEEDIGEFAAGRTISVRPSNSSLSPTTVVARARSKLGKRYSLFDYNCEHFVSWANGLRETSPQLQALLFGITLTAMIFRSK